MRSPLTRAAVVLLALIFYVSPLQAQTEIGIDSQINLTFLDGETTFDISIPQAKVRVGSLVGSRLGLETSLSFQRVDLGTASASVGVLGARVMQAFRDDPFSAGGPYVFGGAGLLWLSADSESANQFSVEAGIGTRVPVRDFFNVRLEAGYTHAFDNADFFGTDGIFVGVGISTVLGR